LPPRQIVRWREAADRLFDVEPDDLLIREVGKSLKSHGSDMSGEALRKMLTVPIERRSAAIERLRDVGFAGCALAAINAARSASGLGNTTGVAAQARMVPRTDTACQEFQLIIDAIVIIAALDGLGCLAGCVPCCGIAAGALLFAGILEFIHDWFC
jgi:hypothetical protein